MPSCRKISLSAFALGVAALSSPAAATPLDDMIAPTAGTRACFTRVYDEAHLRRIPKQQTTSMTLWLKYDHAVAGGGLDLSSALAIKQRNEAQPLLSSGGCAWEGRANRDTQGKRMIKTFRKDAGATCNMSARPDIFASVSAQEGGVFVLDPGKGGDSVTVHLDDSLMMVRRSERSRPISIKFGPDDRVFQLRRTDPKECEFLERAVTR